ncbi:MAG: 4Fe-4S dicluster domain-containing protein, partial [Parasporobacterium sp.]|nr:4Fe-4S dicluster domain-containing protein [Parasporobacterium sp.]
RLRDKVKFVLMECEKSFDRCFCVSMGTNVAEDYDAAVHFTEEGLLLDVKDEELKKLFAGAGSEKEFTPAYVTENHSAMTVPDISDRGLLPAIIASEYWRQFDEKCIACGGCNTVCPTCSCFDTSDIIYQETDTSGERKRTWGSCMLDSFTVMAGGASVRKCHGDNMRFKTLHKMYDFNARFQNGHMCVGCGRCDARCPEDIHFSEVVNGLAEVVENIKKEAAKEA